MKGEQLIAAISTALVNILLFIGMAAASFVRAEAAPEEPEYVPVELMEMPKLGKEPDPKALPRIVKAPTPPPPDTDVASLSREKKEQELEEENKKRELAEQKKRDELDEKERKKQERKEARDRKRAMARALRDVQDERADEDTPDGFKEGLRDGTSTNPNFRNDLDAFVSYVSGLLTSNCDVPATVSTEERKRLKVTVFFKLGKDGKLRGQPKLSRSSGNRQFDKAALDAVRKFGPGTGLRIVPPRDRDVRNHVLKKGIKAILDGKRL